MIHGKSGVMGRCPKTLLMLIDNLLQTTAKTMGPTQYTIYWMRCQCAVGANRVHRLCFVVQDRGFNRESSDMWTLQCETVNIYTEQL